ncbi:hypothetical protein GOP47_0016760 [Adiantum capillus-veneris]|uniref:Fucosyltransferase n=1 Tax=Adiantum capillus-veneris TaxID=13818 RepID=A0A9D4UIF0_ADICA|nr:hypothetical protein GOP47_0016760 [Adiantum capillus-veneris]
MKGSTALRVSAANSSRRRSIIRWAPWLLLILVFFSFQADLLTRSAVGVNRLSRALELFGGIWETPMEDGSKAKPLTEASIHSSENLLPKPSFCEAWLEQKDQILYSRNFSARPILVGHGETSGWSDCAIDCEFQGSVALEGANKADAIFGLSNDPGIESIVRSMESAQYYPENNIENAHGKGITVVMTTSLASDVPVGYFSWAEYDLMAPPKKKNKTVLAAAFISNCGGHNFRLEAITKLREFGVSIDSYGACLRNQDGHVNKLETLRDYKFSLAFENSNEDDYVTEKFWQSLVAGSIPVVIGAPNIYDFAPSPKAILHIKSVNDIEDVANQIMHLASHEDAYNASVSWKYEGPSDAFKALVDMAVVHSSCRLCIHLGTKLRLEEDRQHKRPCKCKRESVTTYHLFVRERGKFKMESVFLRSSNLTVAALHEAILSKFASLNYVPIFKSGRPKAIQGDDKLKLYKVYPVGMTQRQALYSWKFESNRHLQAYVEKSPCANLEVIFV